jgi:hypothetical protein
MQGVVPWQVYRGGLDRPTVRYMAHEHGGQPPQGPQWGPIPDPHQSAPAPAPKRRRRWPWIAGGVFALIMSVGGIGNLVSPPTPSNTSVTTRVVATSTVVASTTTAVPVTEALTTVPVTTTVAPPVVTTTVVPPVVTTTLAPAPPPVVVRTLAPAPPPPVTGGTSCGGDTYVNVSGNCVPRPTSAASPPPGATARCNDGTYSFSQHHSGTCSSHGGVAAFL